MAPISKLEFNQALEPGDKLDTFLDHLNAEIRERLNSYGGTLGFTPDGHFETSVQGAFNLEQGELYFALSLVFDSSGGLEKIVAEIDDEKANMADWQLAITDFIRHVTSSAFSGKKSKFFNRTYFSYEGAALDGEYWIQGARFAPIFPEDEYPFAITSERIVCIDEEIEAINDERARSIGEVRAKQLAARLALITDIPLYPYRHGRQRWVIFPPDSGMPYRTKRMQLGFRDDQSNVSSMPRKGFLCDPGKWDSNIRDLYRHATTPLSLPSQTRKILRSFKDASPEVAEAFDRAARLYQIGLRCLPISPTVGLSYRVATVEAICQTEGSPKHFSEFMRQYAGDSDDFNELYNFMYSKVRSAHFHAGAFPSGEYSTSVSMDAFTDAENELHQHNLRSSFELIRVALINWMLSKIDHECQDKHPAKPVLTMGLAKKAGARTGNSGESEH